MWAIAALALVVDPSDPSIAKADRARLNAALSTCVMDASANYVADTGQPIDIAITAGFGKCSAQQAQLEAALMRAATPEGGNLWTVEQASLLLTTFRQAIREKVTSKLLDIVAQSHRKTK